MLQAITLLFLPLLLFDSFLKGPTLQALAADYESGQKESEQEQIFRGVCRPNCFAFCHLNVHVRDVYKRQAHIIENDPNYRANRR